MLSFECKSIEWLIEVLNETEPSDMSSLERLRDSVLQIGTEAESTRRMSAAWKALGRQENGTDDPETLDLQREVLDKLRLLDRRMSLGSAAIGVKKFCLFRDGAITAGREKR